MSSNPGGTIAISEMSKVSVFIRTTVEHRMIGRTADGHWAVVEGSLIHSVHPDRLSAALVLLNSGYDLHPDSD